MIAWKLIQELIQLLKAPLVTYLAQGFFSLTQRDIKFYGA